MAKSILNLSVSAKAGNRRINTNPTQLFNHFCDYTGTKTADGFLLTYLLANFAIRGCDDSWYATESGGAYGVIGAYRELGLDREAFEGDDRAVLLKDTDAVMDWVHTQAVLLPECTVDDPFIDKRLIGPTMLAIYPGYYSRQNGECKAPVFDAFLEGLKKSCGDSFGGALVSFLDYISEKGETRQLREAINQMPSQVLGFIAAHGMNGEYPRFWQERYYEALLEGCRYQLAHPDEKYYGIFEGGGGYSPGPLVFQLSRMDGGGHILAPLGLTKGDIEVARKFADSRAGDEHERTAYALRCLGQMCGARAEAATFS